MTLTLSRAGKRGPENSPMCGKERIKEMTDVWAGERIKGVNRAHALHAGAPGKAGATHASPLRPTRTTASDSFRLARRRENCPYLYHYPQWLSRAVSRGGRQDPQRQESGAGGHQARYGLAGKTGAHLVWKPASDTLRLARPREHCPHLFLYPQWVSRAEKTLQRLARSVSRGARRDPQRREGGAKCGCQALYGLTGKTGAHLERKPRFRLPPPHPRT